MLGVLDMERIRKDLIELREATEASQRAFAKMANISYRKIQAIEKGERGIWVEDLARWLDAAGLSLALYLSRHLTDTERTIREDDKELYALFRHALATKRTRNLIGPFLENLFPARARDRPARKRQGE